jgi:hypothetical protein
MAAALGGTAHGTVPTPLPRKRGQRAAEPEPAHVSLVLAVGRCKPGGRPIGALVPSRFRRRPVPSGSGPSASQLRMSLVGAARSRCYAGLGRLGASRNR